MAKGVAQHAATPVKAKTDASAAALAVTSKKNPMEVIKKEKKPRAAYERQPAEMSNEEWKKMQVGMDAEFPPPKYMEEDGEPGRSHYRDETYMTITRWTAETEIRYRPHAKAPGSKSHVRYEQYSKAKTIGEALELGSSPQDWCWDYERGFLQFVGGRVRDEPIDSTEVNLSQLSDVDRILARWFIKEAAKMLGVTLQELREDATAKDKLVLRMKRKVAEGRAMEALKDCSAKRRKAKEQDVLHALKAWGFRKNVARQNAEDATFVFSDTLGLVSDRMGGCIATKYTLGYPNFSRLLCKYLRDHLPEEVEDFTFTSISINKNYAGRRHRDGNNVGPNVMKAFGDFEGGRLLYFPDDDHTCPVEDISADHAVTLDVRRQLVLFDGRRAHEVEPFTGERFSLLYFTCPRDSSASTTERAGLRVCNFPLPYQNSLQQCLPYLASPEGYKASGQHAAKAAKVSTDGEARDEADVKNPKFMAWESLA